MSEFLLYVVVGSVLGGENYMLFNAVFTGVARCTATFGAAIC